MVAIMKTVSCFVFADLLNLLANSCYSCSFNLRICKLVVERSHPPPLDATLIHESGYCSHKPDVSMLGSAHHPKAVRIRVLPWCRGWLGSLIGFVWVSGHGGWSAEDAGWEGRGV